MDKMDKVITIYEAKANLSKLVKLANSGKTIYIGAFGIPQAVIGHYPLNLKLKSAYGKTNIRLIIAMMIS